MRLLFVAFLLVSFPAMALRAADRPNIVWVTSEDNGKQLGCYGDAFADTPRIDALAARGVRYDNAWSNAPVCAPARTTIITGVYPPRLGAEHMRSFATAPEWLRFFPQLLRDAGYYCTNNAKTDYNLAPGDGARENGGIWNESSTKAHWRNRPAGSPFFAVFNFNTTHESQTRRRPHQAIHDPLQVPLPPYWPDSPIVRRDWAQYYDKMTEMDREVGAVLDQLEADGLADDTIVFYYSDHGAGFPRCKRSLYESGLGVPLIVAVPPKWRQFTPGPAGSSTDRLVGFVDLAPTVLRVAGVEPPAWMDGHAFLGPDADPPPATLFGFRGRMDARADFSRAIRDQRWLYIRNYLIDRAPGQFLEYSFMTPMTREWKGLYDQGALNTAQSAYWENHPAEELFDLATDPHSLTNLAADAAHHDQLLQMRAQLQEQMKAIGDTGFLPEAELRARASAGAEGDLLASGRYDLDRIAAAADAASRLDEFGPDHFVAMLSDNDSAIRYWGLIGLWFRGADAVRPALAQLAPLLDDASPSCRVAAAESIATYGDPSQRRQALATLVGVAGASRDDFYGAVAAWYALDRLDALATPIRDELAQLDTANPFPRRSPRHSRMDDHLAKLARRTLEGLEAPPQ
jgi:uncharacterized sulfatase